MTEFTRPLLRLSHWIWWNPRRTCKAAFFEKRLFTFVRWCPAGRARANASTSLMPVEIPKLQLSVFLRHHVHGSTKTCSEGASCSDEEAFRVGPSTGGFRWKELSSAQKDRWPSSHWTGNGQHSERKRYTDSQLRMGEWRSSFGH